MNAGFDRYYQIVKCFRIEDLRGSQPELQVDLERHFLSEQEIQDITEAIARGDEGNRHRRRFHFLV